MPTILRRLPTAAVLFVALTAPAAQPPNPPDDPLPDGAKARFGTTRPLLRNNPAVALVPPGYTTFLAPTVSGGTRRYDLGTGRRLAKGGAVVGSGQVVVSADGKRAAVTRVGFLAVGEVVSGKRLLAVRPPEGVTLVGTPDASLSADGKVLAYGGRGKDGKGEVVVWDVDRNEVLARVTTAHATPVPVLSRDGKTLATHAPPPRPALGPGAGDPPAPAPAVEPGGDRAAQVWDVAAGEELFRARVSGIGGPAVAAAFSPDGELVAASAADGPVDVWEVKTGKRRHTLLGRRGQGVRVAFSPDGKTVASVAPDDSIERWSADGTPLGVTEPPPGIPRPAPLAGLAFPDNDRVVAWATAAQFAVAWEAPSGRLLSPLTDHVTRICSVSFPPGGKDLFTSGFDGRVIRWDLATAAPLETIPLRPARLPRQPMVAPVVNLSADATRGIWATSGTIEVFDVTAGADLFCIPIGSPSVTRVSLSGDGLNLVALSRPADGKGPGSCTVWDLAARRVAELDVPHPAGAVSGMPALSPDGTRLAVAFTVRDAKTGRMTIVIAGWDLKTGKKLAEVEDPKATGTVYLAAADGTTAVLVSSAGRLWSVDYAAGRVGPEIDTLPTRGEAAVYGPVEFSPDGKLFATGVLGEQPETYGVRVYDRPSGKARHTFVGHGGPVTALRFSPDGRFLASGSFDTSVLLWDLSKLPGGK